MGLVVPPPVVEILERFESQRSRSVEFELAEELKNALGNCAIWVEPDQGSWRKALLDKPIGPLVLASNPRRTRSLLLLAGEEASTKSPLPPQFLIQADEEERLVTGTGYGLAVLANVGKGEFLSCRPSALKIASMIWWERWEERLDPADYFSELTRNPECWLSS